MLLPVLFGGWVYGSGLRREGVVSGWPGRVFAVVFAFAATGATVVVAAGTGRHPVALGFLGLIALGYARIGYDLLFLTPPPAPTAP
jgi:hypothetical protein